MKNVKVKSLLAILLVTTAVGVTACGAIGSYTSLFSLDTTSSASDSTEDVFTDRDLEQEADLTDATYYEVSDGEDIEITEEGVYVISGSASDVTITVTADDTAKVQIVLDGVTITNTDFPAIYVTSADKVFVTTTEGSENTLEVTGTYTTDGDTNTDAVIFSKEDLVLNGLGTLTINSAEGNAVSSKDELKITGGTYVVTAGADGFEANDAISIYDGTFTVTTTKDAFQSEYDEDDTVGSIYIAGGTYTINAGDDGFQATTTLVIDDGTFDITAVEALEGTNITINGGTFTISASDDGINATAKSTAYEVEITINGGDITITMGSGDTDAVDANGSIYINGGTLTITANSAFDYDETAELNGGTVTVNGEEITEITNSMGGGQMGGGMPSQNQSDSQTNDQMGMGGGQMR